MCQVLVYISLTSVHYHASLLPAQAAPYLGHVDQPTVKELIKRMNLPAFQATHALLGAVGRCDPTTGNPLGMIKVGICIP